EKMWADFQQQNQKLVDLCLPAQIHDKCMCEYIEKLHQEVVDSNMKNQQDLEFLKKKVNMDDRSVLNQQVLQETRDSLNELDKRMSSMQQINTKLMIFRRLKVSERPSSPLSLLVPFIVSFLPSHFPGSNRFCI
ncbi:hypothetical protein AMECASPLE_038411, partial [Ameca splendens]